ncbi:glycoside hydrolase family 5 protein [Streptomyces sp. NBC_00620]|uniref:glycoside hydrolase family 5 protein n=1 Tax=Streptomyces sp. NBC_00620 TaxID=2903666 RepID=UPI00224F4CCE|nr:cellulase family glycosylhydrolase [Streptomyces sp. NBC_00620]MCX4977858.1 glycoside hydrolase family 5 protein [Streptomyces sp. NBC_00620]
MSRLIVLGLALAAFLTLGIAGPVPHLTRTAPRLHVEGSRLVDGTGAPVVLRGVNRPGGEYACAKGMGGVWDGPMDDDAVAAMKDWHVKAVRVPLNSACWNGAAYTRGTVSADTYRSAVRRYVDLLDRNGMTPVLDLHWSEGRYTGPDTQCATARAVCAKPMPDAGAVPFWRSVAETFKDNTAVVLDLYNEPFPDRALPDTATAWMCWRDGGAACAPGISAYRPVGMDTLVKTVRGTGAKNVILLAGINYAHDLSQWHRHRPADPTGNLAASWHAYDKNPCNTPACWNRDIVPLLTRTPVVVTEIGQTDCRADHVTTLMNWLDAHRTGYLAWAWTTYDCAAFPALITGYEGTPTDYGQGVQDHMRRF